MTEPDDPDTDVHNFPGVEPEEPDTDFRSFVLITVLVFATAVYVYDLITMP